MRKYLWVIAFLIFAPSARADTYQVTSGFISIVGSIAGSVSLSGPGFTFTGGVTVFSCPVTYAPGQPIQGCDVAGIPDFVLGGGTLVVGGVAKPFVMIDGSLDIIQAPMFLSGATQATLTEPAELGGLSGCSGNFIDKCSPPSQFVEFTFPSAVFTVSLTQDSFTGGYDVTSEKYTFSTPEPGTWGLVLLGIGLVLVMRKRIARGLPQAT
jgi:hypothetical protein